MDYYVGVLSVEYREEKIRPAQTVLGVGAQVVIHLSPPLSVTHVNRVPAQILAAGAAEIALAARTKRLHSDVSAEQVSVCGRINLDHDSGIFVSEDNIGRVWDVAAQRVQRPRIIPPPNNAGRYRRCRKLPPGSGRRARPSTAGPARRPSRVVSVAAGQQPSFASTPRDGLQKVGFYQAAEIPLRQRGEEASLSQLLFRRFEAPMVKHSSRPGVVSKQPAEAFAAAERQLQTGDQEGETPRNLLPGKVPRRLTFLIACLQLP